MGQEAWGPFPGPLHAQLGLVPVGEWEVTEAQALLPCKCRREGKGGERLGIWDIEERGRERKRGVGCSPRQCLALVSERGCHLGPTV